VKNNFSNNDVLASGTHGLLVGMGYKLVDDAWKQFGRKTYIHEDEANKDCIKALARSLQSAGWQTDSIKLRTFCHISSDHEIELEPGGSGVTGHILHFMKLKPANVWR
jgi:hypothetical protein